MASKDANRARYRKLYTRLWRHEVFLGLSRDDRLLVLYVLTGPQTNRLGYFAFSPRHVRDKAWGRCRHDPKCESYAACVALIAEDLVAQQEQPA